MSAPRLRIPAWAWAWTAPVLLFLGTAVELIDAGAEPLLPLVAFVALWMLPLGLRARWPLGVVVWTFLLGAVAGQGDSHELSLPFLVLLMGAYAAGRIPSRRDALIGLAAAFGCVTSVALAADDVIFGDFLFPMVFATAAWAAGRSVRQRTLLAAELHEAALAADEARGEEAVRAVADERRRIARELHDLVAHSVSVMVVQAGGARRILEQDPARATEAAARIEQTGREALVEMRRLLGLMGGSDADAQLAPAPTLERLDGLVASARAAGLPVTVEVEGRRRPLPPGAEVAAYRVVQEALTNALKHAGRADTAVTVRWGEHDVELLVEDAGAGAGGAPALPAGGHGLIGMRERVRTYGGELEAGPRTGGGFRVRARLPLHDDDGELAAA